MPTRYLLVKGKVQGVFYRALAKKEAVQLGITGWIRNTANKEVETIVTGEVAALDKFESWCRTGPQLASVSEVLVEERQEEQFTAYSIVH
jgi:acylphosphatase